MINFLFFHENMLWVLIRSAALLLMSTHNICFSWRNKKNVNTFCLKKSLIWNYNVMAHIFPSGGSSMAPDSISYFSKKAYFMGTLSEALLTITHNIWFEQRHIFAEKASCLAL